MAFLSPPLARFLHTQPALDDADVQRGQHMLMANGVCSMAAGALQGGVLLSAFALAIGATNYEIGLLASIGLISQVMQLPGLYLVERFARRRAITLICAGLSRLVWVFIIAIPFLFAGRGVSFLIVWLVLASLVMSTCNPAWNSLLRSIVPTAVFGRFFARRLALGTTVALVLTLAGGYFVDWWTTRAPGTSLYAYSAVFFLGLLFGLAELVAIARLPEPTMARAPRIDLVESLGVPLRDGNFRALLVFIAAWSFAVNMAAPFFIIYMLQRIGLSLFLVTVLATASQLTNILFLQIWGRLADRFSNKAVLSVSGPLFLLAILAWCFTTLPERHSLTLNWAEPARHVSVFALHLKALDFVFVLAAVAGFYALNRLVRVVEAGEITEKGVVDALVGEVIMPLRTLSSAAGIRRLAAMPVEGLRGMRRHGPPGARRGGPAPGPGKD